MDKSYIAGISCPCPMQVWLLPLTEKEPSPLWVEIKNKSTNVNLFNVNTFWISVSYGTHWHQNLRHKFMNLHKILCEMQRWGIMEMLGDLPLEKKDFHIKVYDVFWFDAWFACSVSKNNAFRSCGCITSEYFTNKRQFSHFVILMVYTKELHCLVRQWLHAKQGPSHYMSQ